MEYSKRTATSSIVKEYWMRICSPTSRWLVILLLVSGLAACQPDDGARVVTIGGTTTPNTPGEATWLSFKNRVETASGGRMRFRPLIYGQLGSEEQLLSSLRRGRIQYANLSAQSVGTLVPELSLLYAPSLFADYAEADYVYDRYLTDIYRVLLAEKGLHLITWYEIGFHHVYSREPIIVPADARGRRFRVSTSLNARLFAEAIGADVIPLGFGDIVSSLQTGLIAAGENAVSLYARTGIAGEAPHLTLTSHSFGVSVIVSQKQWWDALPEADRRLLAESFPGVGETRRAIRRETEDDLASSEKLGFVVHGLTPLQQDEWRRVTAPVVGELIQALGGR
ncbi:MAG: TRAP transporter substrate-binding protein DctP, partial [Gammaproteobacteria bacterium]|nr:TRAP transporter substrate-binding protein DctP [Gammaproteobacteria bacterium]